MKRLAKVLAVFVLGCMSVAVIFGQSPAGGVNGTVTDPTGSVVPGVTVRLTNQGTGIVVTAVTNASGVYAFVNVAPGMYSLKAEKSGFKTASAAAFQVDVDGTVTLNIPFSVGQVTETVVVTGEAPLLQASTSELGTVIGRQAVENLPMNGRNFTEMTLLVPGVSPVNTAQEWGSTVALPGSAWIKPSVDGQWNRSNVYLMDGIINTEGETAGYSILPSLDAVQEFTVETHNDKAEYGLVMGGTVNLATKTGTNALHGSAFEYLRNQAFNARNPFTDITTDSAGNIVPAAPATFKQNQFGVTLGGPVYIPKLYDGKGKTFFFFSYDAWRFRQAQASLYHVPTPAELSGNFSAWQNPIYDPATTRPDPNNPGQLIRDPFPGNIIPANRISSMMVQTMKFLYDTPNLPITSFNSACTLCNVINNRSIENDANAVQVRIDHQISPKANLFLRYNYFKQWDLTPDSLKNGGFDFHKPQQAALGWNQLFTPKLELNTRFATTGTPWDRSPEKPYTVAQWSNLGWAQISRFGGQINLNIPGVGPTGVEGDPDSIASERNFQLSQDLSWIKGNHQLKFGYLFFHQNWWGSDPYAGADFAVDQTADPADTTGASGLALASALLGLPNDTFGSDQFYNQSYNTWGFYGQDQWKVKPRFTLNYSLRWEFVDPPVYHKVTAGDFNFSTGDYWIGGTALPGPCATVGTAPCIPGNGVLPAHIRLSPVANIKSPHRRNFEPRVGIAWEFAPKTLLRAGVGLAYDIFSGITQENNNIQAAWPNNNYANANYNQLGQTLTSIDVAQGASLSLLPQDTPWLSMFGFDPGKKPPYSVQYHVQLQREFTQDLTVSAAYSGSVTRRLDYGYPVNADPTPGPGTFDQVNARRPFPYIQTAFGYSFDNGRANYNSLQVEANRRFSRGLMLLVAYTWSKSIDNGNSGWFGSENGPAGSSAIQNAYDIKSNRSVSAYDTPQNLAVSGSWELPVGRGKRWLPSGPLSWILGNWRTDFIQSIHSGSPWNPYFENDWANVGRSDWYMRPDLVGNPTPTTRTSQMWVNPAAFSTPAPFTYGNVGRDSFRSKSVFETDFTLAKVIPIGERVNLQFRAELYNLFNVMNYAAPNADFSQPNFGQITSLATTPRQFQFGLRLTF
jgi:hypothetical protein